VASTDDAGFDLPPATTYLVPDWVRVRRESFGLLFYDTRSTKLTFVRSGDALAPPPFAGPDRLLRVGALQGGRRAAVRRLLENLVDRGLIVATEAE
jgi:putative mycofactocin binding protein MftB